VDLITLFGTAIALGMDAFAVAAAVSATLPVFTRRHVFRLVWHFGLFQSLMTLLGWLAGERVSTFLAGINYWLAFGLLVGLGLNMIRQSSHPEDRVRDYDPTRGWSLVGLSIATSIDALAVGVSFGLLNVAISRPALVIGVVALIMTYIGAKVGLRTGAYLGKRAELVGGLVLIGIGINILAQYLIS
jgi:manganese efflux pump family protein